MARTANQLNVKPFKNHQFFDNSDLIKGKVYARLMRYQKAIDCLKFSVNRRHAELTKQIKQKNIVRSVSIFDLLSDLSLLANCYEKLHDYVSQQYYINRNVKYMTKCEVLLFRQQQKKVTRI